ncbi:MAG: ArsR/SmtB family transcription factor [Candidatus Dormibacteria bacterium]|jgi:DNA-binding transcriptional ArsR family regulator
MHERHTPTGTEDVAQPVTVAAISTLLHALGDPVRLELVRELNLAQEPVPCCRLQAPVTKSTLSYHFRILREAGIIEQTMEGVRKLTTLRREELDLAYPGLLDSVLSAPRESPKPR